MSRSLFVENFEEMSSQSGKKLRDKLAVQGFIRENCESVAIPEELISLCFIMYFINIDQWIPANKFELLGDSSIARRMETGSSAWNPIFGSILVKKGDIQTWKLKRCVNDKVADNEDDDHFGLIGIIDINSVEQCDGFFSSHGGYGLSVLSGNICAYRTEDMNRGYSPAPGSQQIITMTLDLTVNEQKGKGTLSYKFDNIDQGVAVDSLDIDLTYCLAMSLCRYDAYEIIP